jgi:hypothetical protein
MNKAEKLTDVSVKRPRSRLADSEERGVEIVRRSDKEDAQAQISGVLRIRRKPVCLGEFQS